MPYCNAFRIILLVPVLLFGLLVNSCAPPVELISSWTSKDFKSKSKPIIMALARGKNPDRREMLERALIAEFQKKGHSAVSAIDSFKVADRIFDSAGVVSYLSSSKIDLLLTVHVLKISEEEKVIPGSDQQVPVSQNATPANPFYNNNNIYAETQPTDYKTVSTPAYTLTEVQVLIESKLFDVSTHKLVWKAQFQSNTQDPSEKLFRSFSRILISDLSRNKMLKK